MLALCVTSAACAAGLAFLLLGSRSDASCWPRWRLWLVMLLVIPGQILPLVLLWQAWRYTYFLIPFLGPPIRVGMGAVWWAVVAVAFSYTPAVACAWKRHWAWWWMVLHPCGTIRMVWRGLKSHTAKHAG